MSPAQEDASYVPLPVGVPTGVRHSLISPLPPSIACPALEQNVAYGPVVQRLAYQLLMRSSTLPPTFAVGLRGSGRAPSTYPVYQLLMRQPMVNLLSLALSCRSLVHSPTSDP